MPSPPNAWMNCCAGAGIFVDTLGPPGHNGPMAPALKPQPVKLICGMIASDPALMDAAQDRLAESLGPCDIVSPIWPFDFTQYYQPQMGDGLQRRFVSFATLAGPDALSQVKNLSNRLEAELAAEKPAGPPRPINLDMGYIESAKLVLASMKNFAHRIYLGAGVYAEVTLLYRQGRWEALPWTFPDYAVGRYDVFLTQARTRLRNQLQETLS